MGISDYWAAKMEATAAGGEETEPQGQMAGEAEAPADETEVVEEESE